MGNDMSGFEFLQYERTGDLTRIAINRPLFNVLDFATMAEMNLAMEPSVEIRPMSQIEKCSPMPTTDTRPNASS